MKDWKKVKLGSLLTESKVLSEKPDTNKRIRVKLNVLGVEKRPDTNDKEGATKYYVRKAGQFVYGKQNLHKGAFGIIPDELDGYESSLDIPAFDIDESCYPEWIFYFFKKGNFYLKLEALAKGVGSKRIHPNQIYDLDIFLPSKDEQESILMEIKEIEKKQNNLISEIEKQEEYVSKLRQSILQDAIQGNLTKEWRKQNPRIESAAELLKRIKAEKNQLIIEKVIKEEPPINQIDKDEIPFNIPNRWSICKVDSLTSIVGGLTKGKKQKEDMLSSPYLRVANVQRGYLDLQEVKEILVSKTDYKNYQLEPDDLLIIEGGDKDKVGRCAIWKNEIPGCIYQNHIYRLRPFKREFVNEYFIMYYLNSPIGREYFESKAKQTTNLASINKTAARNFPLALPPLKEQNEIVDKINKVIERCESLETAIIKGKNDAERLMQSLLKDRLGDDNKINTFIEADVKMSTIQIRKTKFDSKTTYMKLVKLLEEHGKLHAEELWKMSEFPNDIDAFYTELKTQIEEKKTIKEAEKGYLELA